MAARSDAAAGVFVTGVVLVFVSLYTPFTVPLLVVAGLLMVGAVTATARQRRTGPDPEVTLRPGGEGRPWRHDAEG